MQSWAVSAALELSSFLPPQGLQFVEKRLFVLKIAIHRSKADVGDLVQVPEALYQKLSFIYSRYLPVWGVAHLALHPVNQFRKPCHADRTFFAGFQQSA